MRSNKNKVKKKEEVAIADPVLHKIISKVEKKSLPHSVTSSILLLLFTLNYHLTYMWKIIIIHVYNTLYLDIHINKKKNIKMKNLIKSILFKSRKQIYLSKNVTFVLLLSNKTYWKYFRFKTRPSKFTKELKLSKKIK